MKKFLLIMLGLLVLGGTGVSVYVSTIDWNEHKDRLAEQLMEITGRKFVFGGPVNMTVFPMPSLNASNIKVYSADDQEMEHPLMFIRSAEAQLSFSALLGGSFDVKMMSLINPEIYIRKKGKTLNWMDNAKTNSQAELKEIHVALDSVMLRDATMKILDEDRDKETILNNLNAEIIADSLDGPYRIDGSYVKGNNPEGFAISIGNLSDSFATNLNFVLSQPSSETYIRFDGSFLLSNEALNGNLILESKKFKSFYDSIFKLNPLPQYWDKPLEVSTELKVNKTQAELSNMILKYGTSAGAGSIVIPFKSKSYIIGEKNNTPNEVSVKFEMTDLDLEPIIASALDFGRHQHENDVIYSPDIPFDMVVDISALKAGYNGQIVKNFGTQIALHDNVWQLDSINGVFPGNSEIKASGKLFPVEDVLSYTLNFDFKTTGFKKFLEWINIPVKTVTNSTYQKAAVNAVIAGDVKAIQISPFTFAIDNTVLTGQFGAKKGNPTKYAIEATTDSIILDNYLPRVFEGNTNKAAVLKELWEASKWLNNVDLELNLKAGLLIYEKTSFEKVVLKGAVEKGVLHIESFNIEEFLKSHMDISGEISGFGEKLQFSNMIYKVSVADFVPWMQRLNIAQPKWNLQYFQPFSSSGTASLNTERLWVKTEGRLGSTDLVYNGRIEPENKYALNGELELRAANASDLLKNLPVSYVPNDANLGRLGLKAQIAGNLDQFKLSDMLFNVGANTFQGVFGADSTHQVPHIEADLKINRFEPERFLPKGGEIPKFNMDKVSSRDGAFIPKPNLSDEPFQKEILQKVSWIANLTINELLLKENLLKNVSVQLENKNNEFSVSNFQSVLNEGSLTAGLKFKYADKPQLSGDVNITNQNIHDMALSGKTYGLQSGTAELNINMNTSAVSPRDILDHFTGSFGVNIDSPLIKGWDLASISADLLQRKNSEGFPVVLRDNLQQGETLFNKFSGQLRFEDGNWSIDRAAFKSSDTSVDISGTGNLQGWYVDEHFVVQLSEPQNVQPFGFSLKGSLSNPELEVDGSKIMKVYDDELARKEAAEKARKDAHDRDLRNKMEIQRAFLTEARAAFDKFVDESYNGFKNKITPDKYLKDYAQQEHKIEQQIKEFDNAELLLKEKEYKDEYPALLSQAIEKAKTVQEEIYKDMEDLYRQDLKDVITRHYQGIQNENAEKDNIMQENMTMHDSYLQRLNKIETTYRFQTDPLYNQLLDAINSRLKDYENIVQHQDRYGETIQEETEIPMLEKYVTESEDMLAKSQISRSRLTDDIKRYLNYIDEKLKVEEQIYHDRKASEAEAKKIEENTGTISASGKTQKVIGHLDEQENPEKDMPKKAEDDELTVDLFGQGGESSTASGIIIKK